MTVNASTPIEAHLRAAEKRLVDCFALRSRAVPPQLGGASGQWKDQPVTVITRAYEGDAIGYMRIALASGGGLVLASLVVLPRANRPTPILGADISHSGARAETTLTADLTPVRDALEREAELGAIARLAPDISRLPRIGDRTEWRSPSALLTRVGAGQEEDALKAFDGYVAAFITLLAGATPSAERAYQVRAIQDAYVRAHRMDAGLAILGTIFGKAWADEYVAHVLFPVSI
jgi:Ferredoxin-dependent bilin reductase